MYRILFVVTLSLSLFGCASLEAQRTQLFQIMFYNVENLFDTMDDPNTNDDEFLPNGDRHWTPKRYYERLRQTAKVITAVGEWDTPALVGLCEVENDSVLTHLITRTPLKEQHYRYCITKGNDPRGINNALLYQRDKFKLLGQRSVRIPFSRKGKRSRDILHVWGQVITGDTLDVMVCHFPSRSAGQKESEQDRMDAAKKVRYLCDSLYKVRETFNAVVMGDFNDTPKDRSIQVLTNAPDSAQKLLNLFGDEDLLNFAGSHKYQGEWSQLDQMMVSPHWQGYLKANSAQIFASSFLLTNEKNRRGKRPRRTYQGYKYEGGFSDHLPIVAEFLLPLPD